jgi:hypothetical protein
MEKESIQLSVDTKRMLSYRAIRQGVSLKSFIESELERIAEEEEDEILYELSLETEGVASQSEQEQFEKYLNSLIK